jgi:hypothetical protein
LKFDLNTQEISSKRNFIPSSKTDWMYKW